MRSKKRIVLASASIAVALILIGIIIGDAGLLGNLIIIAVFISMGPYFIFKYSRLMWIRSLEEQFPSFVRDLADSSRSGMSFPEAVRLSTKAHYGKLTPEVQLMNNRLSWGTPFIRVLEMFNDKVEESKMISEAIEIIKQSYGSGGSIPKTLDSVSRDMIMLKEAEAERSSMVKQQVMIMYGIFFMFLGISIMIIFVMVPMIESQADMETTGFLSLNFANPCESAGLFPCGLFSMVCTFFNTSAGIGCYYLALFFSVIIIQGVFMGLIAGQLGENSTIAGTKHSMIMVLSAIGIFMFLSKLGFLPV
jgi:flagellar protein FlaJ